MEGVFGVNLLILVNQFYEGGEKSLMPAHPGFFPGLTLRQFCESVMKWADNSLLNMLCNNFG